MTDQSICEHKNKATSAVRIRGQYRTYCLDCNVELVGNSRIAEIFEEMEDYQY